MFRLKSLSMVALPCATLISYSISPLSKAEKDDQALLEVEINRIEIKSLQLARRLTKPLLPANAKNKRLRLISKTSDGIGENYVYRRGTLSKSYPLLRISKTIIDAPIKDIEDLWFNQHDLRPTYDKLLTTSTQTIKEYSNNTIKLMRTKGAAGYILPTRDYTYHLYKTEGGSVGLSDFSSSALIISDASSEVSQYWNTVRGKMNSILILEPYGGKTKATYIVEMDYSGWILSSIASIWADKITSSLYSIKNELEKKTEGEEGLSIEEIARKRIEKMKEIQRSKEMSSTIIDTVDVSKEDLEVTLIQLENRLETIMASERKQKINLSELKRTVTKDITKIKDRIKKI